jgi:hypothetical protein
LIPCAPGSIGSSARALDPYDRGPRRDFLKDPITPVENIRRVCTGSAVIANVITKFRFHEKRAMAELDGIDTFSWWTTNLAGLMRIVRSAGFARVEPSETFELPFSGGGDWRGLRGVVRAYV